MKNAITTLRIQNFKSIKDVEIKPRRVNLILGEPNVGKSNVLEAISLLGGMVYDKKKKFMHGMLRYEKINQLFYDNLVSNTILIESDNDISFLIPLPRSGYFQSVYTKAKTFYSMLESSSNTKGVSANNDFDKINFINNYAIFKNHNEEYLLEYISRELNNSGNRDARGFDKSGRFGYIDMSSLPEQINSVHIRPYFFIKNHSVSSEYGTTYLQPPAGDNLKSCIRTFSELRQDIAKLFEPYGQKLLLHVGDKQLEIVKDSNGVLYSYPYSSIADTLQRLIFYLAAIESNNDAVLLFEEPETHSFPTYVSQLGRSIVDNESNQFFIATHSPYLVTEIMEEMVPNDELLPQLSVFIAYYEDCQTKLRQLTDDEVRIVRANGTEMFYNLRQFTPAGQE